MTGLDLAISRRRWLLGVGALIGSARVSARQTDPPEGVSDPLDVIRRRADEVGLPGFRVREGMRYTVIGSASDRFIAGALRLCEGLADDYLDHFAGRGFAVEAPKERMVMVALDDRDAFSRFVGVEQPPEVTGIFEVGPNYLVLYDGRNGGPAGPTAERANSLTLFHEAMHQLTFNTGLLHRDADIPLAVSEGLATYGEVRRPGGRGEVGDLNWERLAVILSALSQRRPLIPLADLIGGDHPFQKEETVQLAYAQSWLFVFGLIRNDQATERFRAYLEALRDVERPRPRVELAEEHLGDLARLDAMLPQFAARLSRSREPIR
ncbi:DUF1570 domain-containing protein [Tautonia sociabilis]|uniref:DUF1570 domain-containing protein n=1 Tax=Tautonia sociabilis TaxID=2080755 RepID=A0A432MRA0_9BACT|nr:DUF1570 domain-containing protein [Tautonia sociabilis]RUL89547.1 DUF1570 domain-containing protein [Tautonia sociabilis]